MKRLLAIFLLLCSITFADNPYRSYANFNAGELYLLDGREDLAKYQSGCSIMENVIPIPQGGAQKRPGTKYIAEVKTSSLKTRILPFEFSTSQSYVIEGGNQYFRFFTNGAAVTTGNGTETLPTGNITAHWLLNEIEGVTVADDDGGTHDGTASTSITTLSVTGKVGTGAFDLDLQYDILVADAAALSFTDNSNDTAFSLAAWGYVTIQSGTQTIISKWRDESTTREWRFSLTNERKLQLHLADTSGSLTSLRIAHWLLNEDTADKIVLDEDATSHDGLTQTDNTSVLTAAGATANTGKSFDLGGADAVVITNDNDELSFGDGSTDSAFSIAAWIFVTNTATTRNILSKWDTNVGSELREWHFYLIAPEKLYFAIADESEGGRRLKFSNDALSAGWHFVVATYNGVGGDSAEDGITLYLDGEEITNVGTTSPGTYVAMENLATKVVIGARYGDAGSLTFFYADKIDNVVLFNAELTPAQVSVLWNDGGGTESLAGATPTPFAITDNAIDIGWHFLTSTYSAPADETAAAGGIILYVDGAVVDSTATNDADYTAMQGGAEEVRIGSQRNTGDSANENFWGDKIDEVSIFSDVLTPAEITTLFDETPYEIETPYLTADLFDLKYEQSADVLYITHPSYETRKLSRLANTTWTVDVIGIDDGPFRTENADVADFITASATTGSVTLTATGHTPFVIGNTTGHEPSGSTVTSKSQTGALFKLVHPLDTLSFSNSLEDDIQASQVENTSWMACGTLYKGATWSIETKGTWSGEMEIQRNYTIGAAVGNGPDKGASVGWETILSFGSILTQERNVTTSGSEDDGDADYRVIFSDDTGGTMFPFFATNQTEVVGIVQITSVASPTSAIGTVIKTLASTDATHKWSEGSWSNYRGWPQTVAFFEDRLMFGGNTAQPDTIWGSVTSDYENMTAGVDDDEAVIFTLSSRQVNVIEWLIGKDKLLIGTSGAEWTIAGGTDEPLTPSNVIAKQHSTYGSANLQATLANESVLFFQRGAEKMRELAYNWELDTYVAPDMTILANLVTTGGINDTSFQKTPDSILWTVRADGEMPIFSYERQENITAWSRMVTEDSTSDSDFESVASIHGDPEDEIWVVVERTIDSNTVRYIEQFQKRNFGSDPCDAFYVDCGITDTGGDTTITGLSHLEGETVYVLGDGLVQATKVVSSGQITAATTAAKYQVGLGYEVHLRTMPLSWLGGQTIQGRQKRISEVVSRWYKSGDFSIGKDVDNQQTYSITGQTTDIDRKTFSPGWDRNAYIYIYQKSPEPLTVLSVMAEFNLN